MEAVLAIDQGNEYSGYCVMLADYTPMEFGKIPNEDLRKMIPDLEQKYDFVGLAIERIQSFGMPVGKTIFDSCVWAGIFIERCRQYFIPYEWVSRKDEKMALCGTMKANDTTIRQALINKFAKFDYKMGKGTKAKPDFFYGFHADVWSAYAIGYVYLSRRAKNGK